MTTEERIVHTFKLRGHQQEVLCLDHSSSVANIDNVGHEAGFSLGASLVSGSADHTARLWDLRQDHNIRASICIQCSDEVMSVRFGPLSTGPTQIDSPFARQAAIWASVGTSLFAYDLRKADKPILSIRNATSINLGSQDEINQITFTHRQPPQRQAASKHNKSSSNIPQVVAAADDAGCIRYTDCSLDSDSHPKVILHGSGSMVPCLAVRPHSKQTELASGGTDCRVVLYDLSRPKKPLAFYQFTQIQTDNGQNFNPPMVHALDFSPSGRMLAAGAGNGSIAVLGVDNRRLTLRCLLDDAHSSALASVLFPEWTPSTSSNVVAADRLLASIGNDCQIALWDLGSSVANEGAVNPHTLFATDELSAGMQLLNATDDDTTSSQVIFALNHGYKPNWMVSSRGRDACYPSALFVADTSNDITLYNVPTTG